MALDATSKLSKALIDGLSDTRASVIVAMHSVIREADAPGGDLIQAYLWQFVVTYIYNRSARYENGLARTDNQKYIGRLCYLMTKNVLDQEYAWDRPSGKIQPGTDLTDFTRE